MTAARVTREQKLTVKCPLCRAKAGDRCTFYHRNDRSASMGILDTPHKERRTRYLEVELNKARTTVKERINRLKVEQLNRGDLVVAAKLLDPEGAYVEPGTKGVVFATTNAHEDGAGPMVRWFDGTACNIYEGDIE